MSRVISYNLDYNLNVQKGTDKTYFPIRGWTEDKKDQNGKIIDTWSTNGFIYNPETRRFLYQYPAEFIAPSENDKYIIFQYCRCSTNGHMHGEIEVHASFIPRANYLDSLVYYANKQVPDDNRKYKVNTNRDVNFEVWFTDEHGDPFHDVIKESGEWKIFNGKTSEFSLNFVMFLKLLY